MLTRHEFVETLPGFRKMITKEKNLLKKKGLINDREAHLLNKTARSALIPSHSKFFYDNLNTVMDYADTKLEDMELYDLLVISAVLKHPAWFFGFSPTKNAVRCIELALKRLTLRETTQLLSALGTMENRPHVAITEWKKILKVITEENIINSGIDLKLAISTIVPGQRINRRVTYDITHLQPLLRKPRNNE